VVKKPPATRSGGWGPGPSGSPACEGLDGEGDGVARGIDVEPGAQGPEGDAVEAGDSVDGGGAGVGEAAADDKLGRNGAGAVGVPEGEGGDFVVNAAGDGLPRGAIPAGEVVDGDAASVVEATADDELAGEEAAGGEDTGTLDDCKACAGESARKVAPGCAIPAGQAVDPGSASDLEHAAEDELGREGAGAVGVPGGGGAAGGAGADDAVEGAGAPVGALGVGEGGEGGESAVHGASKVQILEATEEGAGRNEKWQIRKGLLLGFGLRRPGSGPLVIALAWV